VKDTAITAERLAALLEGKLNEAQRAEVVAQLASSEDALGAYGDAIVVVSELEISATTGSIGPSGAARRAGWRRLPAWSWVAMAAALAGVAVAPWLWTRARSGDRDDPGKFISLVAASGRPLPGQWYGTPWPGMRGAGQPLTATARAARLGARLVDLELAVRTRDTTAAKLAAEIIDLVEGLPAGGPVAAVYRDVGRRAAAGAGPEELEPLLARGRLAVTQLAGADLVQLGAWAESGRIAAAQQNAEFFRARESRSMLARAAGLSGLPEPARALVQRLQSDLPTEGPRDWGELERAFSELVRVLGS
jgi:hypothetical protein